MIIKLANGSLFNTDLNKVENTVKTGKTGKKLKGVVLYNGPSVLDNAPVVVIATFSTSNEKTGNMIQTWILRADVNPLTASKEFKDVSVCGNCPHRHNLKGACYVTLHQAPLNVFKSFKKGIYPNFEIQKHANLFKDRFIRLGAYGDPAAVPFKIWDDLLKITKGSTGYTHQLKHINFDNRIAEICMISADTETQAAQIQKQGFKSFRVKTENMPLLENEITCLSVQSGISCIDCGLCDGKSVNVVIDVHGQLTKRFVNKFERLKSIDVSTLMPIS